MDSVIIKNEKWQAEIVPGWGGNLISLTCEGREIFRKPENMQALLESPVLHGLPLLLPANRTKDARFSFEGKEYALPMNEPVRSNHLHGLLNHAPFTLQEVSWDKVTVFLENKGEYYPFPFTVTITDTLTAEGLSRVLVLENTGPGPMPYTLAYHATFTEPKCFSVPLDKRYSVDERMIPTGQLQELTSAELLYCTGMDPQSGPVGGFYTSAGHSVQLDGYCMTVSEQFDNWVLFNGGGGKGYLCIEPQCGAVDGLNNGRCRILEAGQKEIFTVRIYRKAGEA